MVTNFKYTNITYEDIITEIQDRLNADPRFDNYRESAIVQQMMEIFAGAVDITNYYLQRRAEECYFDTAQLRSSVILLSRQLGYVVQRPIPATARIQLKLQGDFSQYAIVAGSTKIQIPYHSVFTFEGFDIILKSTFSVTITEAMWQMMILKGAGYVSDFIDSDDEGNDIQVIQGEIREKVINGLTNPQVSQKFQSYKIEDKEFSNIYGELDYTPPTTKVWVGDTKTNNEEYLIDRKSLVNWQNFDNPTFEPTNNKLCVVRTSVEEDIDLQFGDAKYAALGATVSGTGATTTYDNIYIQYLGTKGSKGNKTGVIGKKLNFGNEIWIETGLGSFEITDKTEFYFKSNLIGGTELEDIDSIRVNAPNIYYSLDRIVTKKDYQSFLKTLTSPIVVKNALAWGEQEEARATEVAAIKKLFNIVFYSVIGDMYQVSVSPYYARTKGNGLDQTVLDNNFDENEIAKRNYYNVYSFQEIVKQLKEYGITTYTYKMIGDDVIYTESQIYAQYTSPKSIDINMQNVADSNLTATSTGVQISFDNSNTFSDIASTLQESLRAIEAPDENALLVDAFPGVTVTWDSIEQNFVIQHGVSPNQDPYYITALTGDNIGFISALGLANKTSEYYYISGTTELSDKIIDMTDILNQRSMVTIQNIYISPVIQNFNIKGTVYVDPLADKESLRVEIADAIYKWLNINADFNVLIYQSNVLNIINRYSNVKYANVYFEPETLTATDPGDKYSVLDFVYPWDGTFYNDGANKYLWDVLGGPLEDSYNIVHDIINSNLSAYLVSGVQTDPNADQFNITTYTYWTQSYYLDWYSGITERNFFTSFVKNVHDDILNSYGAGADDAKAWANSEYFMKEMGLIHKDLLKIIRYNMIDTGGNIAPEYNNNEWIKGGYSLGNEIAKMDVQLIYEYKV